MHGRARAFTRQHPQSQRVATPLRYHPCRRSQRAWPGPGWYRYNTAWLNCMPSRHSPWHGHSTWPVPTPAGTPFQNWRGRASGCCARTPPCWGSIRRALACPHFKRNWPVTWPTAASTFPRTRWWSHTAAQRPCTWRCAACASQVTRWRWSRRCTLACCKCSTAWASRPWKYPAAAHRA